MKKFFATEFRRVHEGMGQSHQHHVINQRCFGDALALCVAVVTAGIMIYMLA